MRKLLIILILLVFTLPLTPSANSPSTHLKMEELSIQIMPEYSYHPNDATKKYPPLLIGYQGTLVNTSSQAQKARIEIPLPKKQKNIRIGYVADYSSDFSELHELGYEMDRNRSIISWVSSTEIKPNDTYKFVIEFYSDGITTKAGTKQFDYTFTSFTDIPLVHITFLEPLKTERFKLLPVPESHQENPYGMNMFFYRMAGMKIGDERTYHMTYTRATSKTTIEIMNEIDGNQKEKPIAAKQVPKRDLYLVIAGVFAFSLLCMLLIILYFKNRKNTNPDVVIKENLFSPTKEKVELRARLVRGEISKEEYDFFIKKIGIKATQL